MAIVYTRHAVQRMALRGISRAEGPLLRPTAISKGLENRKIAFKEYERGIVEVVFVEEAGKKIVISARWG